MDPLLQISLIIIGLTLAWIVLRFLLRLTMRIFSVGCTLIFLLGAILLVLQVFR